MKSLTNVGDEFEYKGRTFVVGQFVTIPDKCPDTKRVSKLENTQGFNIALLGRSGMKITAVYEDQHGYYLEVDNDDYFQLDDFIKQEKEIKKKLDQYKLFGI